MDRDFANAVIDLALWRDLEAKGYSAQEGRGGHYELLDELNGDLT